MSRPRRTVVSRVAVVATAAALVAASAPAASASTDPMPQAQRVVTAGSAAPTTDGAPPAGPGVGKRDDRPHPLEQQRRQARREALDKVLRGQLAAQERNGSQVARLGRDKYVELRPTQTASIFTILAEFGDEVVPGADVSTPGPLAGQIPQPDRTVDNSTYWVEKFDRDHYLDLFFGTEGESFDDFYRELSSGRFRVTGDVSDWVQVPANEASYGSNDLESTGYWAFIEDTAQAWYDAQIASGMTSADIAAYLAQFDVWDRYDHDGDGDFNEPDGYIDHFQAIHAGEGEEAGAPSWTIWSHRWYVNPFDIGRTGPDGNKLGGTPIGDTGLWIGDYTTEPENGGLGVFTHEFGHDLGLPDLYDTAGGENSTAFWTLMSAGSWLGHGEDPAVGGGVGIGTTPGHMGAWEKLQLGWLDYQYLPAGRSARVTLGPASFTSRGRAKQALIVGLPDKQVSTSYNTPHSGNYEWWSGSADNLNVTLTRPLDLTGAASASVSTAAWYDIESGYDYLYAEVSTDGGSTWEGVGDPVDGSSAGQWTALDYDLSAYTGSSVLFRFRYQTDGGVHYAGAFLDDIAVTVDGSTQVDDVEAGTGEWTADGWTRMTGTITKTVTHYYIAENRQYTGYDEVLAQGPYNFGWPYTAPNLVEFFPYQDGLLVSYWDNEYEDNNTSQHPGHGLVLPVDARPEPIRFPDGALLGNRRQPFDATFGLQATDPVTFHREITVGRGRRAPIVELEAQVPSSPAIPQFSDSDPQAYWSADNPGASVITAGQGVSVTVTGQSGVDLSVRVDAG